MASRASLLFLVLALAACSAGQADNGVAAGPVGGSSDASTDAPPAEEDTSSYELTLPAAGALPLGVNDVLRVSDGRDVDVTSAWNVGAGGAITGVFDRADVEFSRSEIYRVRSREGRKFTKPERVDAATASLVGAPSLARAGGMYFLSAKGLQMTPAIAFLAPSADEAKAVPRIPGIDWMLSWPRFRPLADGGVAVAFRDGKGIPRFARSKDGDQFSAPVAVRDSGAAMADFGEMKDGTLAFSYQQESSVEAMISYVVLSHDRGATWSEPIRVSDEPNVHDTSALARADGDGLDLYYIHPAGSHGFSLFRRALNQHGQLGPEERVTSADVGEPSKPSAVRRADGAVIVGYSEIAERSDVDRTPTVQQLVIAELASDAPR